MDHKIAIVGATGNVGREMLNILHDKKFKSKNIFPVASSRSAGSKVDFGDGKIPVPLFPTPSGYTCSTCWAMKP